MRTILFFVLLVSCGCDSAKTTLSPPEVETRVAAVTVVIQGPGDKEPTRYVVEDVRTGQTVDDVMRRIEGADVKISGSGVTAIITSIGEHANGGSAGWTYRVDDAWADRSMGVYELSPPATVTWKYGEFAEMDSP